MSNRAALIVAIFASLILFILVMLWTVTDNYNPCGPGQDFVRDTQSCVTLDE